MDAVWQRLCQGETSPEPRSVAGQLLVARYGEFASLSTWVVGHLAQTLDGFIATHEGESSYVSGPANLDHLHRLRALADAVVIGATTAATDDPLLTTRRVTGDHAVRVVIDPRRRLPSSLKIFADAEVPTLLLTRTPGPAHHGSAEVVVAPGESESIDPRVATALLAARGLTRVLVEGGGITVSRWVTGGALDRLHVAVAPCMLGEGRRGVALPVATSLDTALRPPCRFDPMPPDMLYDFDLRGA